VDTVDWRETNVWWLFVDGMMSMACGWLLGDDIVMDKGERGNLIYFVFITFFNTSRTRD
ncbi:hypothetical protein THOM_0579, partial [Trachipleistophora hominis]